MVGSAVEPGELRAGRGAGAGGGEQVLQSRAGPVGRAHGAEVPLRVADGQPFQALVRRDLGKEGPAVGAAIERASQGDLRKREELLVAKRDRPREGAAGELEAPRG